MLLIMLIAAMPRKKTTRESLLLLLILLIPNNRKPTSKLKSAQTTFIVGEERPLPGGLAKGVGNLFPEMPCIKCGIMFVKKTPEKKAATY